MLGYYINFILQYINTKEYNIYCQHLKKKKEITKYCYSFTWKQFAFQSHFFTLHSVVFLLMYFYRSRYISSTFHYASGIYHINFQYFEVIIQEICVAIACVTTHFFLPLFNNRSASSQESKKNIFFYNH